MIRHELNPRCANVPNDQAADEKGRLMQSNAKDVTTYIKEATAERQEYLAKLRALCQEVLAGYEEGMDYGGPCYKHALLTHLQPLC